MKPLPKNKTCDLQPGDYVKADVGLGQFAMARVIRVINSPEAIKYDLTYPHPNNRTGLYTRDQLTKLYHKPKYLD